MTPEMEKPSSDRSTELSEKRTGLSEHRTELSEHRTGLSEHRTQLSDVRSHLSNERTHLSYLRTGISLISFGVTLNRFSLFLIQSREDSGLRSRMFLHDTKNAGLGMVVLGVIMLIWAIIHFIKTGNAIDKLEFKPARWSLVVFTLAVVLIGAASTIWMIIS